MVKDIDTLYTGRRVIEAVEESLIDALYQPPFEVPAEQFAEYKTFRPNEFFIVRCGKKSALATYEPVSRLMKRVDKVPSYGITPRNSDRITSYNVCYTKLLRSRRGASLRSPDPAPGDDIQHEQP